LNIDYAAAQTVAAGPLANGMGNTVTASGPRPRLRSSGNSAHCRKCSATAWHELDILRTAPRLDSEHFRSGPRTCWLACGRLSVRPRAHGS